MNSLEKFHQLNENGPRLKIGVVGDAMVDQYYDVRVLKISPEFPISVMHSEQDTSEDFPGGAANVAYQFKHFNVDSKLISFIDQDASSCFSNRGINTELCLVIESQIPRKRRFYSGDFPTFRWDVEKSGYGLENLVDCRSQLHQIVQNCTSDFDVMIFSDYNKGVLTKVPDLSLAKISIVDPKAGDLSRWRGCTVFKPNQQEALALSGKSTIAEAGSFLLDCLDCQAVVITQAGQGISVFERQGVSEFRPTSPSPPAESVIGAGDCFTAFLAMGLGRNLTVLEAAELAWRAGTLYVKNRRNKPLDVESLMDWFNPALKKFVKPESLVHRDYKLVFTNGCFDLLHSGHVESLRFAKNHGDKLVVAVNSDASVSRLKPGRPIVGLADRMKLLAALEVVDFVVSFDEATPLEIIERIKPDVLVKGAEYKKDDIVGGNIVKEVILAPMIPGLSTSALLQKIQH
jgi:D-beta-D-heptose 7-phosphate kinase / D-beta-D-heptose 1-phosphate adenosyltransferase